ncbi:MAG: leucine zipper domain-containing protein [Eubacteriales bacterium]|nr:leucine zipper domain-containing protein [Eubacteriales bacterium]
MKREEFAKRALQQEKSMSALCREYGISRPTGYKWLERYKRNESMADQSRAPLRTPNKILPEMEQLVLDYRKKHPAIGAVKTKRILENKGHTGLPSASTINAIFKRNGCITKEASQAAMPHQRFEKESPNKMWQADFKGHFRMKDSKRCHPLNIIDDCSRFNLCSDALTGEAFGGKEIAVRESHIPGSISLFYRQFRIDRIDVARRVFTLKKAYLIEGDPRQPI